MKYRDSVSIHRNHNTITNAKAFVSAELAARGISTDGITITRMVRQNYNTSVLITYTAESDAARGAFRNTIIDTNTWS